MRTLWLLVFLSFANIHATHQPVIKKFVIRGSAQGTSYQVLYYFTDSVAKKSEVDQIIESIDSSLSLYKSYSLVNQFNQSATGIKTDIHFRKVVDKAISTFKETKGIFDITVFPFTDAWGFGIQPGNSFPSKASIRKLCSCVGSGYIFWEGDWLRKKKACVKLDPNGIAQGYTVDVLADFLESKGISNYLVELGGEIRVKGKRQPDNTALKIAIETPGEGDWEILPVQKMISIDRGAITTSGSYRKFHERGGKKISHIIDARTGMPAVNELISVTVFAEDAITADAFDNALMVMGLKSALLFVENRKDISAHFIYRDDKGKIRDTSSSRFPVLLHQ
jgi:thiamine biosynthesis lipoprotein